MKTKGNKGEKGQRDIEGVETKPQHAFCTQICLPTGAHEVSQSFCVQASVTPRDILRRPSSSALGLPTVPSKGLGASFFSALNEGRIFV